MRVPELSIYVLKDVGVSFYFYLKFDRTFC